MGFFNIFRSKSAKPEQPSILEEAEGRATLVECGRQLERLDAGPIGHKLFMEQSRQIAETMFQHTLKRIKAEVAVESKDREIARLKAIIEKHKGSEVEIDIKKDVSMYTYIEIDAIDYNDNNVTLEMGPISRGGALYIAAKFLRAAHEILENEAPLATNKILNMIADDIDGKV